MKRIDRRSLSLLAAALGLLTGCPDDRIAEGIFAPLGEPLPSASAGQLSTFARGRDVAQRRFSPDTGLGPLFNVTSCGACHERPVVGGGAGRYRNFLLGYNRLPDGSVVGTGINAIQSQYTLLSGGRQRTDAVTNLFAREFRTPPLWGLSRTAPYMHDGRAFSIEESIARHDSEAAPARDAYMNLSGQHRAQVLTFLESL